MTMRTMRDLIRQLAEATIRGNAEDAEDVAAFNKKYEPGDTILVMGEDGVVKRQLETAAALTKTGRAFVRIFMGLPGERRRDGRNNSQIVYFDKIHSEY
jgi:hypothetical protein